MNQYLLAGSSAFALTFISLLIALKVFPKLGLMDRPHKYGLKRKPVPYPGGIVLYFVFLALGLIFYGLSIKMIGLLIGGGLLVLVSFLDDRYSLPAPLRFFVQIIVALIIIVSGVGIETITNPFGGYLELNSVNIAINIGDFTQTIMVLSGLFTIAWIVLIVNTMNWLDGIPGLVSGISTIGALTMFFLSLSPIVNQPEFATLAIIIAMMSLAFWLFDFYPPKIIIGDSGSMFLGFLLAILAIFSGGKIATAFLILGFPILDALYVIIHRLTKKQAPWKGGEWDKHRKAVHLHHRMLDYGLSERQTILIIYLLCAIFGILALFLGTQGKFWAIITLFFASVTLGLFLRAKKRN